jgi:hypothetical protein
MQLPKRMIGSQQSTQHAWHRQKKGNLDAADESQYGPNAEFDHW